MKKTVFRRQTKTQTYISEYGYINIKIDKMEVKNQNATYFYSRFKRYTSQIWWF